MQRQGAFTGSGQLRRNPTKMLQRRRPNKRPVPQTTVQEADPDKVKHNGGKQDVEAVGNRNVGCKTGMGNWYGVEKQIAHGQAYAQQVESTVKLIQDPGNHGIREPHRSELVRNPIHKSIYDQSH